jgi:beta-mannosidase
MTSRLVTGFVVCSTEPGAAAPPEDPAQWIPAVVPGGVHESLLAAGLIEEPYRDRNEQEIRWIEERDWWFRGQFEAPAEPGARARLIFHGLDTVVEMWLNGEPLGRHENMFRPAEFDITDRIEAENHLLLRFSPPLAGLTAPRPAVDLLDRLRSFFDTGADTEGGGLMAESFPLVTLRRKATFSWGWDFGPRVPSIGIWRPVELITEAGPAITGHHVVTDRIDPTGAATVAVTVEASGGESVAVVLDAPSGSRVTAEFPLHDGIAAGRLEIPNAELWWTHDLGAPALYTTTFRLQSNGAVVDELVDRIGLRTIELDRSPDPVGGRLFRFVLNGIPIFARGANWLPASMLVGSVPADRYRSLLQLAADGGMNMLRIWGGGIYEHDVFYELCDELGILLWHDFMFACIDYPSEDPALRREVELEATYQVRRLRNHPSMALWCGNNEVQMIHGMAYQNYEKGNWGWHFFHEMLPEIVARNDTRPYWPGSPWGESAEEGFMAVNGVLDGDRHAWEVWHGFDAGAGDGDFESVGRARHYRRYAQDRGKFISEFGVHAAPELSTLERWISAAELTTHSPTFDAHNKDNPKDKGDALLEIITGLPQTLQEYVDFTMISQAEALKFGVEHYRRQQPHTSGTLIWQFNDVWPGFSWSIVDYDIVPKAGYYFARRAFSPVLASFRQAGDLLELWLTNGTATARTVTAEVSVGPYEKTVTAALEPGQSRVVWSRMGTFGPDEFAWVSAPDGDFPANRLFFGEIKDLRLVDEPLDIRVVDGENIEITAPRFAYFVRVLSATPQARFSDNYVTLRAGESIRIRVTGVADLGALSARGYLGPRR